jgi:hypothetical protein
VITEPLPAAPQRASATLDAQICAWLQAHPEGEDVNGLAAALGHPKTKVNLRVTVLLKRGQIRMCDEGPALRYVLVTP